MAVIAASALCIVYNFLYFIHCLRCGNYRGASGTVVLMLIAAAGTLAYVAAR